MRDPFKASGSVSVADRLCTLKKFSIQQCLDAMQVPGCQPSVMKSLAARIRRLQKESEDAKYELKCCRCRKKHMTSDHIDKMQKCGWSVSICPSCGCETYQDLKREKKS